MPFGLPAPLAVARRLASDAAAVVDFVRWAPAQIERALDLAEELTRLGATAAAAADQFDRRFEAMIELGEQLDGRAMELIALGESMRELGYRFDTRGGELVDRANRVADTGEELIAVLPAFERAVEMAAPLEGAIDRFGRFVDLLPGGAARRRAEQAAETASGERRRAEIAASDAADASASDASPRDVDGEGSASEAAPADSAEVAPAATPAPPTTTRRTRTPRPAD